MFESASQWRHRESFFHKGSAIKEDQDANRGFYGKPPRNRQILFKPMKGAPARVPEFQDVLQKTAN
jgi:hypothetical protein